MAGAVDAKTSEFVKTAMEEVGRGDPLLTEKQVLTRWPMMPRRAFRELVNGGHCSGVHLPAVQFSNKVRGFRLSDVIATELRLWTK